MLHSYRAHLLSSTFAVALLSCSSDSANPSGDGDLQDGDGGNRGSYDAGDGGGALTDAGHDGGAAITMGPPVSVTSSRPPTLWLRSDERSVCRIDKDGDFVCRSYNAVSWTLLKAGPFTSGAVSETHYCGLLPSGAIKCWLFATRDPEAPLCGGGLPACVNGGVAPADTYTAVSAGGDFACGLNMGGMITCWGENKDDRATPPAGNGFQAIASAGNRSCAVDADGQTTCWGGFGFLDSTQLDAPATQIGMGPVTACVLTSTGTIDCTGFDNPIAAVSDRSGFARINTNGVGLCGLSAAGALRCFGTPHVERYEPLPGPYLEVATGTRNVCALRGDDVVECWGDSYGMGAGSEQCKVGEANLTVSGAAKAFTLHTNYPWDTPYEGNAEVWTAGTPLKLGDDSNSFLFLRAATGGTPTPALPPPHQLPEDAVVDLEQSVWSFDASDTGPGTLLCTGANAGAKLRRNGDEFVFNLDAVSSLGSCPGTPVSGQLSWCEKGTCAGGHISGDIGGVAWTSPASTVLRLYGAGITFVDHSYLRVSLAADNQADRWAVIVTSPDGPYGGEVFCVGSVVGNVVGNSANSLTLGEFSSLGVCPQGGTGSIIGCAR